jgi:N-methylhydantoinase A
MYRVGVDIGGTFTDLVAASENGELTEAKVPSDRAHPELALERGLTELANTLGYEDASGLLGETTLVIQGTTVALNAVLQRNGVRTGLLCTAGFRDTLEIRLGYKEERYLFAYKPPPPLVPRHLRLPIAERIDKNGRVRLTLNEDDVRQAADVLADEGVEAVAICFLWSFLNPDHERRAEEIVAETLPGAFISKSLDVLPRIREYNRTSTTVLNAYVGPIVRRYVEQTEGRLRRLGFEGRIRYIQSNGGLAESAEVIRRPVLLLMSGPAAAPAAGLQFQRLAGRNFITLDVGGTSFDACVVRDGLPETRDVFDVRGYRVGTRAIDIETIGAGGGSIAGVEAGLLRVGPESAEAKPGPACYRRGGTRPTVTDAHVVMGTLNPRELLGGRFEIDASLAHVAVERELADEIGGLGVEDAAAGVVDVVNRNMAEAIREITVRRGHDPRDYTLIAGGGAGGLHAAQLAAELEIDTVVVPRVASELCAFGAIVADVRHDYTHSQVGDTRSIDFTAIEATYEELAQRGRAALVEEGVGNSAMTILRTLELRYKDQVYECEVDVSDCNLADSRAREVVESRFHQQHERLYEFSQPGYPCQVVSLNLAVIGHSSRLQRAGAARSAAAGESGESRRRVRFTRECEAEMARVLAGTRLPTTGIAGPVVIEEPNTTIVVPPGWNASFDPEDEAYVLERIP